MTKIKMKLAQKDELKRCSITNQPFDVVEGEPEYFRDENPVSESWARERDYTLDKSVKVPVSINTKQKLADFLQKDLRIVRGSSLYDQLYREHGSDLPLKEKTY